MKVRLTLREDHFLAQVSMRTCLFLAALSLAAACGGSSYGSTAPDTTTGPTVTTAVTISGIAFGPAAIRVSPGAVVTWTNNDNINHNVTFSDATVGAVANFSTGSKTLTMPTTTGTYAYHCTIHANMTGTVEVK
jgi:plastocyanin